MAESPPRSEEVCHKLIYAADPFSPFSASDSAASAVRAETVDVHDTCAGLHDGRRRMNIGATTERQNRLVWLETGSLNVKKKRGTADLRWRGDNCGRSHKGIDVVRATSWILMHHR